MKAQTPQGGRIINIGSVSAKTPRPDSLPYRTTKFGLQGMTHQLTMDGRKYNIVAAVNTAAVHCTLKPASLMIGHHFAISAFCFAASASGFCWSAGQMS